MKKRWKPEPKTKLGFCFAVWMLVPAGLLALLEELRRAACAGLPNRTVRPLLRFKLMKAADHKNIVNAMKAYGYTHGDNVVVMLEKDFRRLHNQARRRRADNELDKLVMRVRNGTAQTRRGRVR
jgi:hypothetical protein